MINFSQIISFICFMFILFGSPKKVFKSLGFGFSFLLKRLFSKKCLFWYL